MSNPVGAVRQVLWMLRQAEDLFTLEKKLRDLIDEVTERVRKLEDRTTHLEAAQPSLIDAARASATGVSATVAGGVIADAVTRLTRLEGRTERLEQMPSAPRPHSA